MQCTKATLSKLMNCKIESAESKMDSYLILDSFPDAKSHLEAAWGLLQEHPLGCLKCHMYCQYDLMFYLHTLYVVNNGV